MNSQQQAHKDAVLWIEGEIKNMTLSLGQENASAAARSVITLAFILKVISGAELRMYSQQIDQIYAFYNSQLAKGVAA